MTGRRRRLPRTTPAHPARLVVYGFAGLILIGTVLLSLPVASAGTGRASLLTALFTSTSAVCVTGLVVVDTAEYWSTFGESVILLMIQLGGFGIMTMATLITIVVSRRVGLRQRMLAQVEARAIGLADVRRVLAGVFVITATVEVFVTLVLAARFAAAHDEPLGRALYLGLFHAISAFNNAGFALFSDSMMSFATDPWIMIPVLLAVITGGLGFPVLAELLTKRRSPRRWSLHTKVTVAGASVLLALGAAAILALEWNNDATLGTLDVPGKLLNGLFHSAMPRTAGFNSLDVSAMEDSTWLSTMILMFIGGGSASTAGGIKITTFFLLGFVIYAELRGHPEVHVFSRRLPSSTQRQALTVALLGVGAVVGGTLLLISTDNFPLSRASFEVMSAFGTVGLSTGITPLIAAPGQLLLVGLMFLGRLGPVTLGAALVLGEREQKYRYPEERPIIG